MRLLPHHEPTWHHVEHDVEYMVWAPTPTWRYWRSVWQDLNSMDENNFQSGAELHIVLAIFPEMIAAKFRKEIDDHTYRALRPR